MRPAATLDKYLAEQSLSRREAGRLAKLWVLCEALPGVEVQDSGWRHLAFRVAKRPFAFFFNNYHDDGMICLCVKSTPDEQRSLVSRSPERFLVPPYLGVQGWVSLRLDLRSIDWAHVQQLVALAHRIQAPRRLTATKPKAGAKTVGRPSARKPATTPVRTTLSR